MELGLISEQGKARSFFVVVSYFVEHKSVGDFSTITAFREHRVQTKFNIVKSHIFLTFKNLKQIWKKKKLFL